MPMKIVLVKPYFPYPYSRGEYTYNRIWPPLCLANCASLLEKEGHSVKILDAHAQRIIPKKVANYIKDYDKIFITSSSLDKWQCPNIDISTFLETTRYIQELTCEFYIMGYHGTVAPEKILNLTKAKALIRGEPESTILEICRGIALSKIKGISFFEGDKIISNAPREPLELRTLPVPAFGLLNFKDYFYEILGNRFSLFEISRGCYFRCKFCNRLMYGNNVRSKSTEQICEELTIAIEKYNVKTGYFIDLDFLSNKEIVTGLCDFLIKKNYRLKWTCQTRPDFLNRQILDLIRRAGCQLIHMGIETGSQVLLDRINKNISIEGIRKAVQLCRMHGIETLAFFIFGLSGETQCEREETLRFAKTLNTNFASFHRLIAYKSDSLDIMHEFNKDEVDSFIRKAFLQYYLRIPYLLTLSPRFLYRNIGLFWGRMHTL